MTWDLRVQSPGILLRLLSFLQQSRAGFWSIARNKLYLFRALALHKVELLAAEDEMIKECLMVFGCVSHIHL